MTIISLVRNEGGSELLAWRYQGRRLAANLQLAVGACEVAVLIRDGIPVGSYPPGRHAVETRNLPLLDSIVRLAFGGKSPYDEQLWFVSCNTRHDIKWGTDTPVQLTDDTSGILLSLRGYGQFGVCICDPELFLQTVCRNLSKVGDKELVKVLRAPLRQALSDILSAMLREHGGYSGLAGRLGELSQRLLEAMQPVAARYGVTMTDLYIGDLLPDARDLGTLRLREQLAHRADERSKP